MTNDIHFPEQLTADELDEYLAKGWYRMGQVLFTTNYILYEELFYRVWWLRYYIPDIPFTKTHQKIITANQHFSVTLKPLEITEEVEELYANYRSSVAFEAPETATHFLFDGCTGNVFDSAIIEIRDDTKLIGVGVFDKGNNTISGIMNFYHPDYKKYSLGKYLMLLKINYSRAMSKHWYYPGYIVPGNRRFDYKLFLGIEIAEIWVPESDNWLNYADNWSITAQ